jgi:2-polyprenyl-6-methoxyphenol hydroxylase-like FAD-dependent oxidoreductase
MEQIPFRVVIVGGGTAGWLAAHLLQKEAQSGKRDIDIKVVESSRIPTVGVGEGTTAVFREMLYRLGLDENEFIVKTGATLKLGIRHREWLRKGHSYDGPIDDPNLLALSDRLPPGDQQSMLHIYAVSRGDKVSDHHLFGELMKRDKIPFAIVDGDLVKANQAEHAFHFDQAKVGAFLRSKARGIEVVDADVEAVRRDGQTGNITALVFADGSELEGDFFFDCTGFRRKLITELGASWVSYLDWLPVNRAMPFWLEHNENKEIPPYTLAWAQQAGWMWSIPTQDRIGCGYVYSDNFIGPDEAKREIEAQLGFEIEPRNDIRFDSGRVDRAWIANCLALGLSSSFLEPLEATSIHGTVVQLMYFNQFCFKDVIAGRFEAAAARYNEFAARQLNDFRTFINTHYAGERDEPFWVEARTRCMHETSRDIVKYCEGAMPRRSNFTPLPGNLAHINEQLYYPVLDGLGFLDRDIAKSHLAQKPKVRAHVRKSAERHIKLHKQAALQCLGQRDYLREVGNRVGSG